MIIYLLPKARIDRLTLILELSLVSMDDFMFVILSPATLSPEAKSIKCNFPVTSFVDNAPSSLDIIFLW